MNPQRGKDILEEPLVAMLGLLSVDIHRIDESW
jgi:hypothetical protein